MYNTDGNKYTMNEQLNPNTGSPWNPTKDFTWENPDTTFYGLRNPQMDHKDARILFLPQGNDEVLVCWVNVWMGDKYVNSREVMTTSEARSLWNTTSYVSDVLPSSGWVRDDSIPARYAMPKEETGKWEMPDYSVGVKKKMANTNYALEA